MENEFQILAEKIEAIRTKWGNRLCILGHFYQRPEILAHADVVGDSFKLSKEAAQRDGCDAIVFCGVHFMAETADMLANAPHRLAQREKPVEVLLPDLDAGCPMADMATFHGVEAAWNEMAEEIDVNDIAPITYVNSSAAIKAFCGKRGGFCCTSSNADKVLRRAFSEKKRVLFLPDEHLGENTAVRFGIPDEEILFWHHPNSTMLEMTSRLEEFAFLPRGTAKEIAEKGKLPLGGNTLEALRRAKIILWKGFCPVHQQFMPRSSGTTIRTAGLWSIPNAGATWSSPPMRPGRPSGFSMSLPEANPARSGGSEPNGGSSKARKTLTATGRSVPFRRKSPSARTWRRSPWRGSAGPSSPSMKANRSAASPSTSRLPPAPVWHWNGCSNASDLPLRKGKPPLKKNGIVVYSEARLFALGSSPMGGKVSQTVSPPFAVPEFCQKGAFRRE